MTEEQELTRLCLKTKETTVIFRFRLDCDNCQNEAYGEDRGAQAAMKQCAERAWDKGWHYSEKGEEVLCAECWNERSTP